MSNLRISQSKQVALWTCLSSRRQLHRPVRVIGSPRARDRFTSEAALPAVRCGSGPDGGLPYRERNVPVVVRAGQSLLTRAAAQERPAAVGAYQTGGCSCERAPAGQLL